MGLTNEIKDKIVLALTSTTREQCRGSYGTQAGARCATGLVLTDVYGADIFFVNEVTGVMRASDPMFLLYCEEVGDKLHGAMVEANNSGSTFDEIAKLVKEWPVNE